MSATALEQALESIYLSLDKNNEDLDQHIDNLKAAMKAAGQNEAVIDPSRLPHNNRQGRKLMQSYFRKRGVAVTFAA